MEYNLQRTHAEYILRAQWFITEQQWMQFYLDAGKLRDHPPVTTCCWMRRIDGDGPFSIDNVKCTTVHETGSPPSTTYRRITKTQKFKVWHVSGQYS